MSGLDQYAIPYDPDSVHQLHWTPGHHGKGFYTDEGVLHHWNVDREDGQPQHRRYFMESPALGYDPYGHPQWDKGAKFWISPSGEVEMMNNFNRLGDVLAIDPRLGAPSSDWRFADYRTQDRAIDPGPPKLVSEYPDATPEAIQFLDYNARRPFIYHAPSNTVYVGRPSTHHHQVEKEYGLTKEDPSLMYEGYVIKGYPKFGDDSAYPDEAAWFHRAPANHEAVLNEVATAHGVPPSHFQEQSGWRFGNAEDEIMKMFAPLLNVIDKPTPIDPELERKRKERAADPVGYERTHSWDRPGDVQRGHPDIEWVPTHELRKFMEYDRRPGGKDSWENIERWNALGEHLKTQGFKNPIWLDFNPDTGYAHMSEGNHRTQIALDQGIPAVPVRVYRSRRTSPTQIPVKAQPQEEWADAFDPTGYHWPQYMKPSHLGLPTVPPPDQRTAASGHVLNWQPGQSGKGLFANGVVHTWPVHEDPDYDYDYFNNPVGRPTHQDYKDENNLSEEDLGSEFWINPQGYVSFFQPHQVGQDRRNMLENVDPNLRVTDISNEAGGDEWHFSAAQYMYHVAPAAARESIYQKGLTGHEGYHNVQSPWEQNYGQPPGNYFYEHLPSAQVYASLLGEKANNHMFPGDLPMDEYYEHGVVPYGHEGFVRPDPPAGSEDWDDDQWDDWYQHEEDEMIPYNHHDPAHRNLLPPNLQGYDVWRVRTDGLPIAPDPENYLVEKSRDPDYKPLSPDEAEPEPDWESGPEHWNDHNYDPIAEQRWMTHEHVPTHRLELHQHIPAWAITDEWADRAHEQAHESEMLVDPTWTMIHPRHIIPKRVPPEVRKIWGRFMRESRQRKREGLRGTLL